MKISNDAMIAAYDVAKRIREGTLTRAEGINELHMRFSLNRGSAGDTISNIGYILDGKRYVRTNNAFATEYFLEMIYRDYGMISLKRAITAVEKHIEYYTALPKGSKLPKLSKIAANFRKFAEEEGPMVVGNYFSETAMGQDLEAIDKDNNVTLTTKRALVDARLGQGKFRKDVLQFWGNCCSVTGSKVQSAIRASHIKPWRESSNTERIDPNNGLPLIANLDALFDTGLISFDSSGELIVSSALDRTELVIFGIDKTSLRKKPTTKIAAYLAFHRLKYGFEP